MASYFIKDWKLREAFTMTSRNKTKKEEEKKRMEEEAAAQVRLADEQLQYIVRKLLSGVL